MKDMGELSVWPRVVTEAASVRLLLKQLNECLKESHQLVTINQICQAIEIYHESEIWYLLVVELLDCSKKSGPVLTKRIAWIQQRDKQLVPSTLLICMLEAAIGGNEELEIAPCSVERLPTGNFCCTYRKVSYSRDKKVLLPVDQHPEVVRYWI